MKRSKLAKAARAVFQYGRDALSAALTVEHEHAVEVPPAAPIHDLCEAAPRAKLVHNLMLCVSPAGQVRVVRFAWAQSTEKGQQSGGRLHRV